MKAKYSLGIISALLLTSGITIAQNGYMGDFRNNDPRIVINNYYDGYDYQYSSRINRFHRTYTSVEQKVSEGNRESFSKSGSERRSASMSAPATRSSSSRPASSGTYAGKSSQENRSAYASAASGKSEDKPARRR